MRLNELRDNSGAHKTPKRVGRGPASGKGKTAGRGQKGQKSRSGVAIKGFEGGQMPIYRRLPKRGFNKYDRKNYNHVNLDRLQKAVEAKKINPENPINAEILQKAGVIRRIRDGIRILARGNINIALTIEAEGASQKAITEIKKLGGDINLITTTKNKKIDPNHTAENKPKNKKEKKSTKKNKKTDTINKK